MFLSIVLFLRQFCNFFPLKKQELVPITEQTDPGDSQAKQKQWHLYPQKWCLIIERDPGNTSALCRSSIIRDSFGFPLMPRLIGAASLLTGQLNERKGALDGQPNEQLSHWPVCWTVLWLANLLNNPLTGQRSKEHNNHLIENDSEIIDPETVDP